MDGPKPFVSSKEFSSASDLQLVNHDLSDERNVSSFSTPVTDFDSNHFSQPNSTYAKTPYVSENENTITQDETAVKEMYSSNSSSSNNGSRSTLAAAAVNVGVQTEQESSCAACDSHYSFSGCVGNLNIFDLSVALNNQKQNPNEIWQRFARMQTLLDEKVQAMCSSSSENYPLDGRAMTLVPLEITREMSCDAFNDEVD